MRRVPMSTSRVWCTACSACAALAGVRRAGPTKASPAAVSRTGRVPRTYRGVPSSRSRAWIEFDRPDCTMSSRLAARVMLRSSASARKWRSCLSSIGHRLSTPELQHIWTTPSARQMKGICARCRRTGIGVLTGVVDADEPVRNTVRTGDPPMADHSTNGAAPLPAAGGSRRAVFVISLICAAQFVLQLDFSIVNVALPSIQRELGMPAAELQWIVTGYALAFGSLLLAGGRLADLLGRRRVLIVGLALFAVASLACGLAQWPIMLIIARIAQGAAGAMVSPAALSLLTEDH